MMMRFAAGAAVLLLASAAQAGLPDAGLCQAAIASADGAASIPANLLGAIGLVESGRIDPVTRRVVAWPWTINVQGQGRYFESKAEAVAAVTTLLASGIRSIDVGCMQVNLMHHPNAFPTLDHAFDPLANVAYAARFLNQLYRQTGNWPGAAAAYHSQTPELAAPYQQRVMAAWPQGARFATSILPATSALHSDRTPEFAREMGRGPASRGAVLGTTSQYTAEFARELAQEAAVRAARNRALGLGGPEIRVANGAGRRPALLGASGSPPFLRITARQQG